MRTLVALILALIAQDAVATNSIQQMVNDYNANQARFHQNWRNKVVIEEGVVTGIKTDPLGTGSQFNISISVGGAKVICDTKDTRVAASLDKGARVEFSGVVHDVVLGSVDIRDCSFRVGSAAIAAKKCEQGFTCRVTCRGRLVQTATAAFDKGKIDWFALGEVEDFNLCRKGFTSNSEIGGQVLQGCRVGSPCVIEAQIYVEPNRNPPWVEGPWETRWMRIFSAKELEKAPVERAPDIDRSRCQELQGQLKIALANCRSPGFIQSREACEQAISQRSAQVAATCGAL